LTQTDNIFFADYGDRASSDNWQHLISLHPSARRVTARLSRELTCRDIAALKLESHFWLIDGHCQLIDRYRLNLRRVLEDKVYVWETTDNSHESMSLMYVPADGDLNKEFCFICERVVKLSKILYDVIVINYGEPVNYPGVKQITAQLNEREVWAEAANMSDTQMFWLIDSNVTMMDSFDLTMNIPLWDTCYIHHWPDDLLLIPKNYNFTGEINYKYHKSLSCIRERSSHVEMTCDTFFLSYNEHNADTNFDRIKQLRPNTKRIHGVTGIFNAHSAAAELSDTDWFWIIDGDNYLLDTFDFTVPKNIRLEPPGVFVFACLNKAIEMSYGNGGIKLMHRSLFNNNVDQYVDLATSFENFTYVDVIASETHIDTDSVTAWRSAFRECAKLSTGIIKNSDNNINRIYLNAWLYANNSKYKEAIQLGAAQGQDWARNNPDQLYLINDYAWLEQYYKENT